jgi:hypothetical protein
MVPQRQNLRDVGIAALLVGAAALVGSLLFAPCAHAQFGAQAVITVPGSVEQDQPVEQADTDIDTVQLPAILQQDTLTATSVTTTLAGGWYQPQAVLLGNLSKQLFNGINPQTAAQLMPVTQGLPCDSYTPMTTEIAPALAYTYNTAISQTQQLITELQGEDFTGIAANVQAPAELAATQANGQVGLAIVQELQLMRAQLAALTMIVATDKLHQLDSEVRPTMPRLGGGC